MIHKARNVVAKVSADDQAEVKADYWAIFDDLDADPGEAAVAEARRRAATFPRPPGTRYPSAVACVTDDLDAAHSPPALPARALAAHPPHQPDRAHLRRDPPRPKVIGRLPGERSCLSLVWAVLDRARRGWRGVDMTPSSVRILQQLRANSCTHMQSRRRSRRGCHPRRIGSAIGSRRPDFSTISGTPPSSSADSVDIQ